MIILLYISVILLKAAGDGLNDSSHKPIGHISTTVMLGLLVAIPVELVWRVKLVSFTLLMIALFDLAYNKVRGLPWSFVGTSNLWDQAIAKVPFHFMLFVRIICLIVGIFLILNS